MTIRLKRARAFNPNATALPRVLPRDFFPSQRMFSGSSRRGRTVIKSRVRCVVRAVHTRSLYVFTEGMSSFLEKMQPRSLTRYSKCNVLGKINKSGSERERLRFLIVDLIRPTSIGRRLVLRLAPALQIERDSARADCIPREDTSFRLTFQL